MADLNSLNQHPVNRLSKQAILKLGATLDPMRIHALQLIQLTLESGRHGLTNQEQVEQQTQMIELLDAQTSPQQTMEFLGLSGAEQTINATTLKRLKDPIERGQTLVRTLHLQMVESVETYP